MTTFILALLCYSATSYVFSGSICYVAAKADINENQEKVNKMPTRVNMGIMLLWPLWILREIEGKKNTVQLAELAQETHQKQNYSTKYTQKRELSRPIGELLQQAGLITENQVEEILQYQSSNRHLRFGEIAVMWRIIKQETADFFVELFPQLMTDNQKKPVGEYLKLAKLLNDEQIYSILVEQRQTNLRFGEVAVQKGWLKQETIDFVLHYLKGEFTSAI